MRRRRSAESTLIAMLRHLLLELPSIVVPEDVAAAEGADGPRLDPNVGRGLGSLRDVGEQRQAGRRRPPPPPCKRGRHGKANTRHGRRPNLFFPAAPGDAVGSLATSASASSRLPSASDARTVSDASDMSTLSVNSPSGTPAPSTSVPPSTAPHALGCIMRTLEFLVSLLNPLDRHNTDTMRATGLTVIGTMLEVRRGAHAGGRWPCPSSLTHRSEAPMRFGRRPAQAGGATMTKYPVLLRIIKEELARYLFSLVYSWEPRSTMVRCARARTRLA